MIVITDKEVYSDSNKLIHRIGTESYFKRCIKLPNDNIENFEEVDAQPKYSRMDYENKVNELIRERYTESQEFSILRQKDTKLDEYNQYYSYCEECKIKAKEILNNEKI